MVTTFELLSSEALDAALDRINTAQAVVSLSQPLAQHVIPVIQPSALGLPDVDQDSLVLADRATQEHLLVKAEDALLGTQPEGGLHQGALTAAVIPLDSCRDVERPRGPLLAAAHDPDNSAEEGGGVNEPMVSQRPKRGSRASAKGQTAIPKRRRGGASRYAAAAAGLRESDNGLLGGIIPNNLVVQIPQQVPQQNDQPAQKRLQLVNGLTGLECHPPTQSVVSDAILSQPCEALKPPDRNIFHQQGVEEPRQGHQNSNIFPDHCPQSATNMPLSTHGGEGEGSYSMPSKRPSPFFSVAFHDTSQSQRPRVPPSLASINTWLNPSTPSTL